VPLGGFLGRLGGVFKGEGALIYAKKAVFVKKFLKK
jgi:hypothetical protein